MDDGMDDDDTAAALDDAHEQGWQAGFTAAGRGCDCPHEPHCPAGPSGGEGRSMWQRALDRWSS